MKQYLMPVLEPEGAVSDYNYSGSRVDAHSRRTDSNAEEGKGACPDWPETESSVALLRGGRKRIRAYGPRRCSSVFSPAPRK